jgi:hypothetical protein
VRVDMFFSIKEITPGNVNIPGAVDQQA